MCAKLYLTLYDPCGLQPARLLCPWNSPGKYSVVGCHVLLQGSCRHRDQTFLSYFSRIESCVLYHQPHPGSPDMQVQLPCVQVNSGLIQGIPQLFILTLASFNFSGKLFTQQIKTKLEFKKTTISRTSLKWYSFFQKKEKKSRLRFQQTQVGIIACLGKIHS